MTLRSSFNIVKLMKSVAIIVMICTSFSLLPLMGAPSRAADMSTPVITLDVCRASESGIQQNPDIPFLCECSCRLIPLRIISFNKISSLDRKPFLMDFQEDRPPKSPVSGTVSLQTSLLSGLPV